MKIKVIIPNSGTEEETLREREKMLSHFVSSDTTVSVECIDSGPVSIESNSDEILAGQALLRQGVRAEKDGYNALVVYCFSDLGVNALRENLNIPVVGPGSVCISLAGQFSNKFSVITTASKNEPRTLRRLMNDPICREKMVSVRAMNIPVEQLREKPELTKEYLEKTCFDAIGDGADTVVLGCLGFAGYGEEIAKKLNITVLDPAGISVAAAEMLIRTGTVHNTRAYPKYSRKNEITVM